MDGAAIELVYLGGLEKKNLLWEAVDMRGGLLALNAAEPNIHFTWRGGLHLSEFLAEAAAVTLLVSRVSGW
jgi:hypothetical protein